MAASRVLQSVAGQLFASLGSMQSLKHLELTLSGNDSTVQSHPCKGRTHSLQVSIRKHKAGHSVQPTSTRNCMCVDLDCLLQPTPAASPPSPTPPVWTLSFC